MDKPQDATGVPSFEFRAPPIIKIGWGSFRNALPQILKEVGIQRPLLVTDPIVRKLPIILDGLEALSTSVRFSSVFDGIPGEPSFTEVEAGAKVVLESGCDGLVAVGGGAVIDTAKAMSLLAVNRGDLPSYLGVEKFPKAGLPLVAIPTTAGTGSEVTKFTVLTDPDTHSKLLITDTKMIPRAALIDPALTVGAPQKVTASSGVDALTHAIEAYVSRKANPLTDNLALSAIQRLAWALPRAYHKADDAEARSSAALGALEAGLAFSNASVALVHGMARPLGVVFGVPHGMANAMLLPVVCRYSYEASIARYRDIARALGVATDGLDDATAALRGIEAIDSLCGGLGIPTLGRYGIDRADLEKHAARMASDALASGSPNNNPRIPAAEEIVSLYLQAF